MIDTLVMNDGCLQLLKTPSITERPRYISVLPSKTGRVGMLRLNEMRVKSVRVDENWDYMAFCV